MADSTDDFFLDLYYAALCRGDQKVIEALTATMDKRREMRRDHLVRAALAFGARIVPTDDGAARGA